MSETLLTLNDVHLTFAAQKNWRGKVIERVYALNGLDMTARRGETLGIVGESGCGKSTLAKLLMGMLKPSSGHFTRARRKPERTHADGVSGSALIAGSAATGLAHHHRTSVDPVAHA